MTGIVAWQTVSQTGREILRTRTVQLRLVSKAYVADFLNFAST